MAPAACWPPLGCALLSGNANDPGVGQVVDAAMVDGVSLFIAALWEKYASGHWGDERGTNPLDTGAATYDVYETSEGEWMAVGSREPQFRERLLTVLELDALDGTEDEQREILAQRCLTRPPEQWIAAFAEVDACVTAVPSLLQAGHDPALLERGTYRLRDGHVEPGPAPRFSRTPARAGAEPAVTVEDVASLWL